MSTDKPDVGRTSARTCGSCVMCCVIMRVRAPDFTKEAGVMCVHCSGSGCNIYEQRPDPCRTFLCLWRLYDTMPEELRPDRTGVMFAIEENPASPNPFERSYIVARAANSINDFFKPPVSEALEKLIDKAELPVWLSFNQQRRLLHPDAELREAILSSAAPPADMADEVAIWRRRLGLGT